MQRQRAWSWLGAATGVAMLASPSSAFDQAGQLETTEHGGLLGVPSFTNGFEFPMLEAAHRALALREPAEAEAKAQLTARPQEVMRTGSLPDLTSGDVRDRAEELSQRFTRAAPAGSDGQREWEEGAKRASDALAKGAAEDTPPTTAAPAAETKPAVKAAGVKDKKAAAALKGKPVQLKTDGKTASDPQLAKTAAASSRSAPRADKDDSPSSSWLSPSGLMNAAKPEPATRPDEWRHKIMPTEPGMFGWDGLP